MITLLDYGMGNIHSVAKALEKVGASVKVSAQPKEIASAEKLVVPGVGSFAACMTHLGEKGLLEAIQAFLASGRPYFGICLGLQILFETGEEAPHQKGLGVFKGRAVRFNLSPSFKIPHMGWNRIAKEKADTPLLKNIQDGSHFYFVHSYHVQPENRSIVATTTDYEKKFVSSVAQENIFACQFHPEKSQENGLRLFESFSRI